MHPKFVQLEQLAEVAHLRGFYRWFSHEVHADSKGTRMNTLERGNRLMWNSGYTNIGLADPGQMSLISLQQATVARLLVTDDPNPQTLLELKALHVLVDEACDAFAAGDQSVWAAERKFQQKMARKS